MKLLLKAVLAQVWTLGAQLDGRQLKNHCLKMDNNSMKIPLIQMWCYELFCLLVLTVSLKGSVFWFGRISDLSNKTSDLKMCLFKDRSLFFWVKPCCHGLVLSCNKVQPGINCWEKKTNCNLNFFLLILLLIGEIKSQIDITVHLFHLGTTEPCRVQSNRKTPKTFILRLIIFKEKWIYTIWVCIYKRSSCFSTEKVKITQWS